MFNICFVEGIKKSGDNIVVATLNVNYIVSRLAESLYFAIDDVDLKCCWLFRETRHAHDVA